MKRIMVSLVLAASIQLTSTSASAMPGGCVSRACMKAPGMLDALFKLIQDDPEESAVEALMPPDEQGEPDVERPVPPKNPRTPRPGYCTKTQPGKRSAPMMCPPPT